MIYRITIADNDFWFLMNETMNHVSKWFYNYQKDVGLDSETAIRELIAEYLTQIHVDIKIKGYILNRLKITKVDKFIPQNENREVYYFFGDSYVHQ